VILIYSEKNVTLLKFVHLFMHFDGRTTILEYSTVLNFTYVIQLLMMSFRCLLCFFARTIRYL